MEPTRLRWSHARGLFLKKQLVTNKIKEKEHGKDICSEVEELAGVGGREESEIRQIKNVSHTHMKLSKNKLNVKEKESKFYS